MKFCANTNGFSDKHSKARKCNHFEGGLPGGHFINLYQTLLVLNRKLWKHLNLSHLSHFDLMSSFSISKISEQFKQHLLIFFTDALFHSILWAHFNRCSSSHFCWVLQSYLFIKFAILFHSSDFICSLLCWLFF